MNERKRTVSRSISLLTVLMMLFCILLLSAASRAAEATVTINGHVTPLPPDNPDVVVCLKTAGQSTNNLEPCYTLDPYDATGAYHFDITSDGTYIITPMSTGYQFNKAASVVKIAGGAITEVDKQPYTGAFVDFATVLTANGACGSANGQTFTSAPTSNLCSYTSTTPTVSGSGPWTWKCTGSNGGSGANCQANSPTPVNGVCGSANGQTFTSAPTSNLCSYTSTTPTVSGSGPWTWNCTGANGGATVDCQAALASAGGGTYTLMQNMVALNNTKIAASAYNYYEIVVAAGDAGRNLTITLGSHDYVTKQELIVAKNIQVDDTYYQSLMTPVPTTTLNSMGPDYWYKITTGTSYLNTSYTIRNLVAGDVYYVLVVNRSTQQGLYAIAYNIN
jgi:hypothetical protein